MLTWKIRDLRDRKTLDLHQYQRPHLFCAVLACLQQIGQLVVGVHLCLVPVDVYHSDRYYFSHDFQAKEGRDRWEL